MIPYVDHNRDDAAHQLVVIRERALELAIQFDVSNPLSDIVQTAKIFEAYLTGETETKD